MRRNHLHLDFGPHQLALVTRIGPSSIFSEFLSQISVHQLQVASSQKRFKATLSQYETLSRRLCARARRLRCELPRFRPFFQFRKAEQRSREAQQQVDVVLKKFARVEKDWARRISEQIYRIDVNNTGHVMTRSMTYHAMLHQQNERRLTRSKPPGGDCYICGGPGSSHGI